MNTFLARVALCLIAVNVFKLLDAVTSIVQYTKVESGMTWFVDFGTYYLTSGDKGLGLISEKLVNGVHSVSVLGVTIAIISITACLCVSFKKLSN